MEPVAGRAFKDRLQEANGFLSLSIFLCERGLGVLNHIDIQGRLAATPELKKTKKDQSVTTVAICCDRDGNRAVMQTPNDWFNVVMYDKNAENFCRYAEKGQTVILSGRLTRRKYTDIYGKDQNVTEIVAERFYFCEKKKKGEGKGVKLDVIADDSDDEELPF